MVQVSPPQSHQLLQAEGRRVSLRDVAAVRDLKWEKNV